MASGSSRIFQIHTSICSYWDICEENQKRLTPLQTTKGGKNLHVNVDALSAKADYMKAGGMLTQSISQQLIALFLGI